MINVDVTPDPEVHVHRIGRTGRADQDGWALSLASMDEMGRVGAIEQAQKRDVEWHPLAELTPADDGALTPPMETLQILGGRRTRSARATCSARPATPGSTASRSARST